MDQIINSYALKTAALQTVENDGAAVNCAKNTIDDTFIDVVRLLSECPGKVIITGSGTSGAIAVRAAHLLSVAGTPAFFLSPSDGLHGGLGAIGKGDVVLAISKGGTSSELNEFCARAQKLVRSLVAVTAEVNSSLAQLADYVLLLKTAPEADLGSVIATGSSLAAGALLDALVEACRLARGYEWKSFFFTHPGGAVGKNASTTLAALERAD